MKEIDEILENYTELTDDRKAELKEDILDLFRIMKLNPKTKKCPYCNGTGKINQGKREKGGYYIEDCIKCYATGIIEIE